MPAVILSMGTTPESVEMGTPAGRQIPQEMQVSSLIAAFVVSGSIQMTSVPVRCGGQNAMHSRWQRLG
ncbi:MAG TPA: hypothetical protein VEO18_01585 [Thermoplasmata archaeon]|nr:hypothetical protein [Thermoplasmata archaeon]